MGEGGGRRGVNFGGGGAWYAVQGKSERERESHAALITVLEPII